MRKLRLRETDCLFKGRTVEARGRRAGWPHPGLPRQPSASSPARGWEGGGGPLRRTLIGPLREASLFPVICSSPGGRITAKQETTLLTAGLQSPVVETEPRMLLPDEIGNSFRRKAL